MTQTSRTFRIFVSSTFSDLVAERNALQDKVFPELQKLCEANQCRFQAIDLRWGVSEEAALDQQTMNICLTELKRCQDVSLRPNFMLLLGDRYGWLPLPPQVQVGEFAEIHSKVAEDDQALLDNWYVLDTNAVPQEYLLRPRREDIFNESDYDSWGETERQLRSIFLEGIDKLGWKADDKRRIKYECSATHQEIIEGALKFPDEREHVFSFLRNIQNVKDIPLGSVFSDAGIAQARALKEEIQQTKGITSFSYDVTLSGRELDSHIEQFTADALASLQRIMNEEFLKLKQLDKLTRERIAHEEFGAERRQHFVGRQKILEKISAYLHGDGSVPLVIHGLSGSGKSALMAKAALDATSENKREYIIQRFIGATPESTDIHSLLENLLGEISQVYRCDTGAIPTAYNELREEFAKSLQWATSEKPLFIFLDALDQLSASENAHSLDWLPTMMPADVKVIISVLEREDAAGQCLRSARSKLPASALLRLEDMTQEEGVKAISARLGEAKRTLTNEQLKSVLSGFYGCPKPLYLKLAFEECRRWKSFEGLPFGADEHPSLAGDIPGVVGDMLARLQDKKQHGAVLVKNFLGLLASTRYGLSETEILELLSGDASVMAELKERSTRSPEAKGIPVVVWLRLYNDLTPYLLERSAFQTVLLDFYHRQVGETVKRDYVRTEYHTRLANYFRRKTDPAGDGSWIGNDKHAFSELPFHLTEAGRKDELTAILTDFGFIHAKLYSVGGQSLIEDYKRACSPAANLPPGPLALLKVIGEAIALSEHVLARHPDQVENQLTGRLLASGKPDVIAFLDHIKAGIKQPWLCPIAPCFEQAGGPLQHILSGSAGNITAISITPDGQTVLTGSDDGILSAWDLSTGSKKFSVPAHKKTIRELIPMQDSRRVLSASKDGDLKIWDVTCGDVLKTMSGHSDEITHVLLTAVGHKAVSASPDGTVNTWDLDTSCILHMMTHPGQPVSDLQMADGDSTIVCAWRDRTVGIQNPDTGSKRIISPDMYPSSGGVAMAIAGRRIVLATQIDYYKGSILEVLDIPTGARLNRMMWNVEGTFGTEDMNSLAVSPDGKWAVTATGGGNDRTSGIDSLKVWDLDSGTEVRTLHGHKEYVRKVMISKDGHSMFSISQDGEVKSWELPSGRNLQTVQGSNLVLTGDGHLGLVGNGQSLAVWDLESKKVLGTLEGNTGDIYRVKLTPDEKQVVTAANDLKVWDIFAVADTPTIAQQRGGNACVVLSPSLQRAVSFSRTGKGKAWEVASGRCLQTLEGFWYRIGPAYMPPDDSRVLLNSDDNMTVWELATGKRLSFCKELGKLIAVAADGWRVLCEKDDRLIVWELPLGYQVYEARLTDNEKNMEPQDDKKVQWLQAKEVWSLRLGSTAVPFASGGGQEIDSRFSLFPGIPMLVAGGRGGGVFFLRVENIPADWKVVENQHLPGDTSSYLRCSRCSQWIPAPKLSQQQGACEWTCLICGKRSIISSVLLQCIQTLNIASGQHSSQNGPDYPVGFWLKSEGHSLGGYSGVCRLCGQEDSDPGQPPKQCPSCGWPGSY